MSEKPSKENKSRCIRIRLTEKEYNSILQKVDKFAQGNWSLYGRTVLLNQKISVDYYDETGDKFETTINEFTGQIKIIGRNFNQVDKKLQASHSPKETQILLESLQKMMETLLKISAYTNEVSRQILQIYDSKNQ
jgi:hypothetical protein